MIYKIVLSLLFAAVLVLGGLKVIASSDDSPAPVAAPAPSADDAAMKSLRIP